MPVVIAANKRHVDTRHCIGVSIKRILTLCSAVAFLLLAGCVVTTPQDLTISEIAIASRATVDEIIETPFHDSWEMDEFLIVGLSTKMNLVRYVRENGYRLSYEARFCEDQDAPLFSSGLYAATVSKHARRIETDGVDFALSAPENAVQNHTYYVLVPMAFGRDLEIYGRPERDGAVFYEKYNLRANPRDLCFQLGGRSYLLDFWSNMVSLPTNEIQAISDEQYGPIEK